MKLAELDTVNDRRWITGRGRTFLWGMATGMLLMALGVSVSAGRLGGVFDRVRAGIEATVQDQPAEQQP